METQFTDDINEKVRSYLCNIKNEYIIHECELIHCINNECIKEHIDTDIYVSFRDIIINVVEDFIIEKNIIEKKEEESFSYEQKLRDVKLYVKYMPDDVEDIIPIIALDVKYNYKFRNIFIYYQETTERILDMFEYLKKSLVQRTIKKYHLDVSILTVDMYNEYVTYLRFENIEKYSCACLFYRFYNQINKEKIREQHKIESLLYLMIYKNVPQDIVRYCIKSYL